MVEYQQKNRYNIDDLLDIMRLLRSEGGCPWDREQTHESIKSDFIEETCEVIEAIDLKDTALLREELGDVLLQVVFHCRIEEEAENFRFDDVCDEVCKKLIVRHPHVFGEVKADTTDQVLKNWDAIKMETKGQETYTDTLRSVAKSLPALMRAQKVGKRAMRAGMDFRCAEDAVACISNEKAELDAAIISGNKADIEEALGDLLFQRSLSLVVGGIAGIDDGLAALRLWCFLLGHQALPSGLFSRSIPLTASYPATPCAIER